MSSTTMGEVTDMKKQDFAKFAQGSHGLQEAKLARSEVDKGVTVAPASGAQKVVVAFDRVVSGAVTILCPEPAELLISPSAPTIVVNKSK